MNEIWEEQNSIRDIKAKKAKRRWDELELRVLLLTLKRLGMGGPGEGQFDPPCGFSKNVSSIERVKLWFFCDF